MTHYPTVDFRKSLRGPVLCPGDPGYDSARTLPNAMIDRRPAIIARCVGAADVIQRHWDVLGKGRAIRENAFFGIAGGGSTGNGATSQVEAQRTRRHTVREQAFNGERQAVVGGLRVAGSCGDIDQVGGSHCIAHSLIIAEVE